MYTTSCPDSFDATSLAATTETCCAPVERRCGAAIISSLHSKLGVSARRGPGELGTGVVPREGTVYSAEMSGETTKGCGERMRSDDATDPPDETPTGSVCEEEGEGIGEERRGDDARAICGSGDESTRRNRAEEVPFALDCEECATETASTCGEAG